MVKAKLIDIGYQRHIQLPAPPVLLSTTLDAPAPIEILTPKSDPLFETPSPTPPRSGGSLPPRPTSKESAPLFTSPTHSTPQQAIVDSATHLEEVIYVKQYVAPANDSPTPRQRQRRRRKFRHPLDDFYAEKVSTLVHADIKNLSLYNARRLVDAYGPTIVRQALERVTWLDERSKVKNGAGLIITVARVIWRERNGWGMPVPTFEPEPIRRSRRNHVKKMKK